MKKRFYAWLLLVPFLLSGCSGDLLEGSTSELDPHKPAIVGQAQAFIDGTYGERIQLPNMAAGHVHSAASDGNKNKKARNLQNQLQSALTKNIQVDWSRYQVLDQDGQEVVLFPLKHTSISVVSRLSVDGLPSMRSSHLYSKLLVKKCKSGNFVAFIATYLPDRQYMNKHPQGVDNLGFVFHDTDYSGYYMLSTLEGRLMHGERYEEGKRVFRFFRSCDVPPSKEEGSVHAPSVPRYHLALNFVAGTKALRALAPETNKEHSSWEYCNICHKYWEDCTCVTVVPESKYCSICNSYIHDGRCNCCTICHKYPCACETGKPDTGTSSGGNQTNPGGGNSGGNSGGNNSGSGNQGGGKPQKPVSHKVKPEKITNAMPGVREYVIKHYGMTQAACNKGVQEAFKAVIGPLPKGMDVQATQMVTYWENNPDKWPEIKMSEAQKLANEGYFVVAGWKNPEPGGSGHVVVVVPGETVKGSKWAPEVPVVLDMGRNMRHVKNAISGSFGPQKRPNVKFYYYK